MNDDFKILFELLDGGVHEVAGRAVATVPTELRDRIAKFAAGQSSEEEREKIKKLLREQPDLIPLLVSEIHALRPTDA
ncbi:MAG: hypothetical protein M3N12_02760 [Verrucomicrobiota bacterium]|nr:hypothetical protein [Verrucomicrobiota bacterium]